MATCALCRRTYSQNREIQKSYTNNNSQPGAYSSKTNTNNHENKQKKRTNTDKVTPTKTSHDILCRCTYFQNKKDKKEKRTKKTTTNTKQKQRQIAQCAGALTSKKNIDKKTNTNDDKYKTKQRQIAQVHILPRENQQQSHEQAVNMAASAAKVLIFIES